MSCSPPLTLHRSVDDLEVACRVTFGHQGTYCDTAPLPYREINLPPKLKFGYYTSGILAFSAFSM